MKHDPNPSRGYSSIEVNRDENNNMNYMVFQENKYLIAENWRNPKVLGLFRWVIGEISGTDIESMRITLIRS